MSDESAPQAPEHEMPPDLGDRLRAARQAKKLSTRQLARKLGVSPALVGHIETGRTLPSINTLYAMATALDLSLDRLFTLEGARPARAEEQSSGVRVSRHNARPRRPGQAGIRWEGLASVDHHLRFGLLAYDAGASTTGEATPLGHEGTEYGYLLSGTLELTVDDEKYVLQTGDSFELDARVPHTLFNPGPHPMNLLWVFDPHSHGPLADE
ncbi:cupin domain-containing protein [Actinomadura welshii]|uniref:cupin domain-containing protein n=1 Tax=Actinomadura welshii TaxID=3103817 RepID=UPI0003AD1A7F|nr:cupin domain-containing protein [Actinomadura madurae]